MAEMAFQEIFIPKISTPTDTDTALGANYSTTSGPNAVHIGALVQAAGFDEHGGVAFLFFPLFSSGFYVSTLLRRSGWNLQGILHGLFPERRDEF